MIDKLLNLVESNYTPSQYPTLSCQANEWRLTKPLQGVKILDSTPIFRNTCAKYIPLLLAGANLTVGCSDVMPYDPKIIALLKSLGVNIINRATEKQIKYDIILDCAAAFSQFDAKIGYVELTRSGIEQYKNYSKPVFIADSGKIKQIETCLGTGDSYFRAMKQLGYSDFKDKNIVVFGTGKVGRGIITHSNIHNANVIAITEKDSVTPYILDNCNIVIDINNYSAVESAIINAHFIITATGVKNAVEGRVSSHCISQSKAIFANMGVEDEWGESIVEERVLNNKQPLNFILEEPTNIQYIETTMALHNYGALYLIENPSLFGIINPPASIETKFLKIVKERGNISNEIDSLHLD